MYFMPIKKYYSQFYSLFLYGSYSLLFLGHREVLHRLASNNAEIDCLDKKGYSPLHAAVSMGHTTTVIDLLDFGANVRIESSLSESNIK